MKQTTMLMLASALGALLFSIHWMQDVVLGIDSVGPQSVVGVAILLVWLYAALLGSERRWGQVIMLLFGFLSTGVMVLHFNGARISEIARGPGGFAFLWVNAVMGVA